MKLTGNKKMIVYVCVISLCMVMPSMVAAWHICPEPTPGCLVVLPPGFNYVPVTNQDGKIVARYDLGAPGCVLTRTQVHPDGDPDLDVWECLENNFNPGVDQRDVLIDTLGNPITERSKGHQRTEAWD